MDIHIHGKPANVVRTNVVQPVGRSETSVTKFYSFMTSLINQALIDFYQFY